METPLPWSDAWLDAARQRTDPDADGLIADLVADKGPTAALELFEVLIRHIELPLEQLPASVKAFVQERQLLPDWADPVLITAGEQVFRDHGPKFLVFLYYKSLPTLYACANGARVLLHTGRLSLDTESPDRFSRRIAETGQFLLDVMSPGGLGAKGIGLERAIKVRLIHAAVRHFIPSAHWDAAEWGQPINQEDLAITLMTFSLSMVEAMETSGVPLSDEEAAAYLHCWKIVGYLMGLEPELLPANVEAGKALLRTIGLRQSAPSEAGRILTQSLLENAERMMPGRLFDQAPVIMLRHLAGYKMAEMLGVVHRRGIWHWLLPLFMRRWVGFIERLEEHGEPISKLMDKLSVKLVRKLLGLFVPYKEEPFRVDAELIEAWGIK